jgi:hypothetical protein
VLLDAYDMTEMTPINHQQKMSFNDQDAKFKIRIISTQASARESCSDKVPLAEAHFKKLGQRAMAVDV